jgi:hypothetical protein
MASEKPVSLLDQPVIEIIQKKHRPAVGGSGARRTPSEGVQ